MYGITNASKGIQDAATISDINTACATTLSNANTYTDTQCAAANTYTDQQVALWKGYPLSIKTSGTTTATVTWNSETRLSDVVGAATIQLPDNPDLTQANLQTQEIRIIIKFANSGTPDVAFTVGPNESSLTQEVFFPDDEPQWAVNKLYEISLSPIYKDGAKMYIIAYGKEITLPS